MTRCAGLLLPVKLQGKRVSRVIIGVICQRRCDGRDWTLWTGTVPHRTTEEFFSFISQHRSCLQSTSGVLSWVFCSVWNHSWNLRTVGWFVQHFGSETNISATTKQTFMSPRLFLQPRGWILMISCSATLRTTFTFVTGPITLVAEESFSTAGTYRPVLHEALVLQRCYVFDCELCLSNSWLQLALNVPVLH